MATTLSRTALTKAWLTELLRKHGLKIENYDCVRSYFDANGKWLIVEVWVDYGVDANRGEADKHTIRVQRSALDKQTERTGKWSDDFELGYKRTRIFDLPKQ